MRKFVNRIRWVFAGAMLLGIGGCVTNQQLLDFTRTQVARVIADTFGRALQVYIQATA
jgi:hypothetical protein